VVSIVLKVVSIFTRGSRMLRDRVLAIVYRLPSHSWSVSRR